MPLLVFGGIAVVKALVFFYDLVPLALSFYVIFAGAFVCAGQVGSGALKKNPQGFSKAAVLTVCMFFFAGISVILQNLLIDDRIDNDSRSALWFSTTTYLLAAIYFLIGAGLHGARFEKSNSLALLFLGILVAGIYINLDGLPVLNFGQMSLQRSDEVQIDHLVIGEPAIFLVALALAFSGRKLRGVLFAVGLMCFFCMGGRTALISYAASVLVFFLIRQSARRNAVVVGLAAILILLAWAQISVYSDDPLVARMLISDGLEADESQIARNQIFSDGLSNLFQQSFIGDPTLIVEKSGTIGAYFHNLLSAWQFFGMIPFLATLFAIIYITAHIWKGRERLTSRADDFGVFLFFYCVISVVIGKAVNFYPFWLSLGFWLYRIQMSGFNKALNRVVVQG
ncbi:hypothetical protein [Variovorax sp.]|uniref:hypothetical protein n=1 Tax=Variovorax sp. TaxID=1871043 RepID=UPI004038063A